MGKTKIEWADAVWNPVTGCTKVSSGCHYCYAERIANRFWGERKFTDVILHSERLEDPKHWKKPRIIFVNSMSDLFHPDIPEYYIKTIFKAMWESVGHHKFLILTKRPERAYELLTKDFFITGNNIYGADIWLGVSVENQKAADNRIPILLQIPAAIRFVSVEPMLEEIKLQGYDGKFMRNYLNGMALDWIICGCESGKGRRPMSIDWVRELRDQCEFSKTPFFLKQMEIDGKICKIPELDGRIHNEIPIY